MTIKIDTGVPMPERGKRGRQNSYPWSEMNPGDSFFAPNKTTNGIGGSISAVHRSHPDWEFTSRAVTEDGVKGVRVWRVK